MIIAAVVFAAYSVVLSSNFGVMDDYTFLLNAIVGNNDTLTLLIGAGRPLNLILASVRPDQLRILQSLERLLWLEYGCWGAKCIFLQGTLRRFHLLFSYSVRDCLAAIVSGLRIMGSTIHNSLRRSYCTIECIYFDACLHTS
jgi:hypothetical protein